MKRYIPPAIFIVSILFVLRYGLLAGETGPIPWIDSGESPATINLQQLMPVIVTIVILAAAVWTMLSKSYPASQKHWAYAAVGTIMGYWLKGGG